MHMLVFPLNIFIDHQTPSLNPYFKYEEKNCLASARSSNPEIISSWALLTNFKNLTLPKISLKDISIFMDIKYYNGYAPMDLKYF